MMITNLPTDLMEDILSRVPLKSMRAVGLTCTKWNTLLSSRIFAKLHIGKAFAPRKKDESESWMIVKMEDNLYLTSVFVDDVGTCAENKGKLTCLDDQVKISDVFHCEGLLLCMVEDDDTRVVVWNPYLGQTRWIQLRYSHVVPPRSQPCYDMFGYSIGYEDKGSCRNYKILRFIDVLLFREEYEFLWYEIYDFESGLWTTLDVTDPYWRVQQGGNVSHKGNTYFYVSKRNPRADTDHIICFDYTSESFGPLLPLPFVIEGDRVSVTLSNVREEKLAALCDSHKYYGGSFVIWITNMIEAEKVSWSKFLTFHPDSLPDDFFIRLTPSFYIDEVKKVAMFCGKRLYCHIDIVFIIGEDGYKGEVNLEEGTEESYLASHDVLCCSYVPSLVQIMQPKGGQWERKQSDLEKLRYDDMMSRLSIFESRCETLDHSRSL
ncbi:unnamed protein product [Microthlaspi erraticum]|uniref:F-box domain-containing protein n=1 Tax=Microthlaspi erraticum TaxID=1685480 RepID=A0A6D2K7P0_9BRAS|nr:unnamed protein product [Microthlaspi erraticum]